MKLFRERIILKYWLVMVVLVLLVVWVTGFTQLNMIRKIYYDQQVKQLSRQAENIIATLNSGGKDKIMLLSGLNDLSIMLVDQEGYLEECYGMGRGMGKNQGNRLNIMGHHGNLMTRQELNRVLAGEVVSYKGPSHFINADVLSVALPLASAEQEAAGAVIVSAPLTPYEERLAELHRVIVYVGIGGILLATLLSFLLSRSLSRPLIQMNNVARGLAAGDFSQQVEVKSEDEIGVLAQSLNTLSKQLQEKIEDLERLDNTRRDFVAGISHELRTPLTIMQGYAEALQDNIAETEEERQEYISYIINEIQRQKRLVAELLDLRRIESGQDKIELQQMDALPVIKRALDRIKTIAKEKGIVMPWFCPADLPPLLANRDRLEQVMLNLLDNAIRHTPEGGVVEVKAGVQDDFVVIEVADSGPGIPGDELELIWEKFYKIDKSRSRAGGGTGLGLAIVKRIVENMGGSVHVSSSYGQGARFIVSLNIAAGK
ncbi:MAG: ATP-binding protein [Bacillota bacterium]